MGICFPFLLWKMEAATILQGNLLSWKGFETRVSDLENWLVALTFWFFLMSGDLGSSFSSCSLLGNFKIVQDLPALADEGSQEVNPVTLDFLWKVIWSSTVFPARSCLDLFCWEKHTLLTFTDGWHIYLWTSPDVISCARQKQLLGEAQRLSACCLLNLFLLEFHRLGHREGRSCWMLPVWWEAPPLCESVVGGALPTSVLTN